MYPAHSLPDAFTRLATRRSVKAMDLQEPGPDPDQLKALLAAAIRVPDHGKLGPWRLLTFSGAARGQFGQALADRFKQDNPTAPAALLAKEAERFNRAPLVIAVISRITTPHKIPEWEQILSAGAVCQNLLLAANLQGFAAQWLTEWYAYDEGINQTLGLTEGERVAGYIYVGSSADKPDERVRPELAAVCNAWSA